MPPFKRSSPKVRTVKKTLADGTVKSYRYERKAPLRPRVAPDSVGALAAAYRASPEWLGLAASTRRAYSVYLKEIDRLQAEPVAAITRRMLLSLRDAIAATRGAGASTGFLHTVSALFTWAVHREWVTHSPAHLIRPLPGGHLTAWTWAQAQHAMSVLPEPCRRVVVLATYTGQRRGDLIALPWSAYDGKVLRLKQQKTGVRLVVPVHPDLRAELDAWRRGATSTIILTTDRGLPWRGQHLSRMLPLALGRIDLPPLGVHGLRKLAATRLAEFGCSMHEIASITGHKSLSMVQLYTSSVDQERLALSAMSRLPTESTAGNRRLRD